MSARGKRRALAWRRRRLAKRALIDGFGSRPPSGPTPAPRPMWPDPERDRMLALAERCWADRDLRP